MSEQFEIPDAAEQKGYSTATKALLDTGKIAALGFRPLTHMREGLDKTVRFICGRRERRLN